ncbi:hypothetical protein BU26DRAFT_277728 [Trematosphaeria pertusa]|uniref:Uncharacterized protein n=1 Tax=Trematosphaeria pertusa TaxID=390896 RepID=A0A6A6INM9_9PLEO|nr:uncharacterized protein BU26DRAFT_277728 [Trematosphaeria pertusa]KAF2251180.1 hypothetical protein BU26DRAFT_277728 [Trematosphaeria pertusa]
MVTGFTIERISTDFLGTIRICEKFDYDILCEHPTSIMVSDIIYGSPSICKHFPFFAHTPQDCHTCQTATFFFSSLFLLFGRMGKGMGFEGCWKGRWELEAGASYYDDMVLKWGLRVVDGGGWCWVSPFRIAVTGVFAGSLLGMDGLRTDLGTSRRRMTVKVNLFRRAVDHIGLHMNGWCSYPIAVSCSCRIELTKQLRNSTSKVSRLT